VSPAERSAEQAAELERLIQSLDPDAIDSHARRDAQQHALDLTLSPVVGILAALIARTLAACVKGEVETHHAKWQLASAALLVRQELERPTAGGAVAVEAACLELATLFPPRAGAPVPPTAEDLELLPAASLIRRR